MPVPPCHLGGLGVLVTRPSHQADALCELIEGAHGRPIRFPALEILPTANPAAAKQQLREPGDLLVFVSANAVEHAYALLPDALPLNLAVAAIGQATAQRLRDFGLDPTLVPTERFDSEGLLALPELQDLRSRRVVIVRGNDGRPTLGDALQARGATVTYVEVYRRQLPQRRPDNLIDSWDRLVDVVTATSNAVLDNLFALLGERGAMRLRRTPLVVVSERMRLHASGLGCHDLHVANSAHDRDILACLCALASKYG